MKKIVKVMVVLANALALLSMCSACSIFWYQPELPGKN
jgi:cyclic lactone autoinducer peptide